MENQPAVTTEKSLGATANRIVDAAHVCFEAKGVQKTSLEDIAEQAGVSRQTIYKYFSGKPAIIEAIALREMIAIGEAIRARSNKQGGFAERLTEILAVSIEQGRANRYVRLVVQDLNMMPRSFDRAGHLHRWERDQWQPFLAAARSAGDLAEDLDDDSIVRWLAMSQLMLLLAAERFLGHDSQIRPFIRRFIVEPLLAVPRVAGVAEPERLDGASMAAEVRAIRRMLTEQTDLMKALLTPG